jgi:hypothetical protein
MTRSIRLIALGLIGASPAAWSQQSYPLAQNVTISKVAPISSDTTAFAITVAALPGASGYCTPAGAGGATLMFRQSSMPGADANSMQRLYATVLLALSTGLPVEISSYTSGTDCNSAAFLEITNAN